MEVTGTPAQGLPTSGQAQTEAANLPPEQNNQTAPQVAKSDEFVKKAQQEREMWQKQKAIKTREAEITAREARIKEYESRFQNYEQTKQQARLNPIEYLKQAGLTPEDLVQYQLNNGSPTPDLQFQQLKAELEETKRSLQERDERQTKEAQEQNQRAAQEARDSFFAETKEYIASKPEEYELINKWDASDYVTGAIEEHWRLGYEKWEQEGKPNDPKLKPKVLSKEEASELTEKWLEGLVEDALKGKKYGSKYTRVEQAEAEVAKDLQADQKFTKTVSGTTPVKTLHNGIVASALTGPNTAKSMDAKMQAALKRLQESKKE